MTPTTRLTTVDDAAELARLLHDFNTEFATPSPGPAVLADRLRVLLAGDSTIAIIAGTVGLALVTLRPNVWYEGPVALLDELYVEPGRRGGGIGSAMIDLLLTTARTRRFGAIEINVDEGDVDAQRFYERHGFSASDPGTGERAFSFAMELRGSVVHRRPQVRASIAGACVRPWIPWINARTSDQRTHLDLGSGRTGPGVADPPESRELEG